MYKYWDFAEAEWLWRQYCATRHYIPSITIGKFARQYLLDNPYPHSIPRTVRAVRLKLYELAESWNHLKQPHDTEDDRIHCPVCKDKVYNNYDRYVIRKETVS